MTDVSTIYPKDKISLREVGLRDGLQMVKSYPSTFGKKQWIDLEYEAGVRHFEVGSFLPAKRYPIFADVRDVIDHIGALPGAHGAALTLNKHGIINAIEAGVPEISCVISASEEHNQANTNRTRQETLDDIQDLCLLAKDSVHRPIVSVGIAMSFGCSIAGEVNPDEAFWLAERCFDLGVDVVSLADTVGYAGPKQIEYLARRVVDMAKDRPVGLHLHDTRGMGIANASAGLDAGIRIMDGAMGGLGGCPFAPNATGNVVFEDLVFLCESSGFSTGIDVEKLSKIRKIITEEMPTEPLYGAMAKAGLPKSGIPKITQNILKGEKHEKNPWINHSLGGGHA